MRFCLGLCIAILWCAACGGDDGSGVSGGKKLVSLSQGEITDLCQYIADVYGPSRMVDCGNGQMITVGGKNVAECVADLTQSQTAYPNCAATVDNSEACAEALANFTDTQLCSDATQFPPACAVLFSADCGGG